MQLLDSQGVGGSIPCRHIVKPNCQPDSLAVNVLAADLIANPNEHQAVLNETKRNAASVPAAGALVSLYPKAIPALDRVCASNPRKFRVATA